MTFPTGRPTPCQSGDPDRFFAHSGHDRDRLARVKDECLPCPVREGCLDYAIRHDVVGIWSATDEKERKAMRKAAGIVPEPIVTVPYPTLTRPRGEVVCPSFGAITRHRADKEPLCDDCREFQRARRQRNRGGGVMTQWDDEPCVCDTDFTCMADEHDKGRCDACERPGIYPLCCGDHQAHMCASCANANHGGEP